MKHVKGFTLIEGMIVVAIVGILLAIAVPAIKNPKGEKQELCYKNGYTSYIGGTGKCYRKVKGIEESVDVEYLRYSNGRD